MKQPQVSIIMPAYNSQDFIKYAIESVLNQTLKDWELIIINDGSTDNTQNIINSFKDKKIKYLKNSKNEGVTASLVKGIEISEGEYIARLDSDDICDPNRLTLQVEYLSNNPKVVIVGSNAEIINSKGDVLFTTNLPATDSDIRKMLYFKNPLIHPSVMFRKKILSKTGAYNLFFNGAEDYELWFRMLTFGKAYNFKKPLIKRRIHDNVVTKKFRYRVEIKALLARLIHLKNILGIYFKY